MTGFCLLRDTKDGLSLQQNNARQAVAPLIPVPYSKPHESYTGELSFPGEFLHDIPGSLFTELETCRRSNSWLLKGKRARGGHTTASCYDCSYCATLSVGTKWSQKLISTIYTIKIRNLLLNVFSLKIEYLNLSAELCVQSMWTNITE